MEELKKNTRVTNSILATARNLLANDDSQLVVKLLIEKLQKSYSKMLDSVKRCKLVLSKRDRLWALFHKFSVDEGSQLCIECHDKLGIEAHEIFWQLLMERQFHKQIISALKQDNFSHDKSDSRSLTFIEESAVRYTAGAVLRKSILKKELKKI